MSIQVSSTLGALIQAIRLESREEVGALCRQFLSECQEAHVLFPDFIERELRYLRREVNPVTLEVQVRRLHDVLGNTEPDVTTMSVAWTVLEDGLDSVYEFVVAGRPTEALDILEEVRRAWQRAHDYHVDLIYGLLDIAMRLLGEERIGPMWDEVMANFYETRDAFDLTRRPWSESFDLLLEDAAASLRGHLSGPGRMGNVEMSEEEDRVVFRFDPCGSGGRTLRRDATEDGKARMEPPFHFGVTTRPHDWAWRTSGVCLYCVHCCQLQERIPIQRLGFPLRVVDPPVWGGADAKPSCTWTVYRDPSRVPESAYERVGLTPR